MNNIEQLYFFNIMKNFQMSVCKLQNDSKNIIILDTESYIKRLQKKIEILERKNGILRANDEDYRRENETLKNENETLKNENKSLTDTDITKLKEQLDDKDKTCLEIGIRLVNIVKLKRLLNNNESLSDTDITTINHYLNNSESHNLANTDIMKLQELLNKNENHYLADTDITKINQLLIEEYNKEELKYKENLDEIDKLKEQLNYNDDINDDGDESHTLAEIEKIKEQLKHKPFIEIAKRLINENKAFRVQGYYTANENKMLFNDIKEQCSYMLYENARLLEEIKLCHTTEVKNLNEIINERDKLIFKLQKEICNDYVVI